MPITVNHSTPADGTFSATGATAWNADHTLAGVGTLAEQNANAVAITGGTINGTTIGATSATTGKFTTLEATGNSTLGTGSSQYIQVEGGATAVLLSAQGAGANIPLALQPKGTGALQAQATTSTTAGGNARGANAVDWQTSRGSAGQVASGFASNISGGYTNTASGTVSVVAGGTQNTTAGGISVIAGGIGNATTATNYGNSYSFLGSGYTNTAGGVFNVIGGGFTNSGTSASAVTTQSGTMNATTAVTLSGSNASIKVGQVIAGTSISSFPPTYVAAISGTSLTLSQAASGSSTSTLSFFTPHGVVVGGGNNQATGSYSFIGGGGDAGTAANRNVASGDWSTVGGGLKNTATNGYATVCGGNNNTVSGASTTYGFIGGGQANSVSGFLAAIVGGYGNTANSAYSTASGSNAITRSIQGVFVHSAGAFSVNGDSQWGVYNIRKSTTDATPSVLTTDTNAASNYNQVILPNNSAYFFRGEVISGVTGGGNTKGFTIEGVIKRGANAASTALVGVPTVTSTYADAGASTWDIAVTADTTNGGIRITFTGQASTTIRTVCKVETTEMTY